jgi:hypothetical protein
VKHVQTVVTALALCWLAALAVGCSTPDRQPASIPVERDEFQEMCREFPDGSRMCVYCRKYPIRNLDGSIAKYFEVCQ